MLSNNQRKLLRKLTNPRQRKKSGFFICEGVRSSLEAVTNCPDEIEFMVVNEAGSSQLPHSDYSFPVYKIDDKEFKELTSTESPQGMLIVVKEPELVANVESMADEFALVLDRVNEPGNFGTIIRTAWAIGLKEVWYTVGTTDPFGTKAVRSGMGAHFHLKFRKFEDLAEVEEMLKPNGGRLCLTKPLGEVSCFSDEFDFKGNAIVLGNEANGIEYCSEEAQEVTIPMPGNAESLNVAQAGTIVLFEYVRRTV